MNKIRNGDNFVTHSEEIIFCDTCNIDTGSNYIEKRGFFKSLGKSLGKFAYKHTAKPYVDYSTEKLVSTGMHISGEVSEVVRAGKKVYKGLEGLPHIW